MRNSLVKAHKETLQYFFEGLLFCFFFFHRFQKRKVSYVKKENEAAFQNDRCLFLSCCISFFTFSQTPFAPVPSPGALRTQSPGSRPLLSHCQCGRPSTAGEGEKPRRALVQRGPPAQPGRLGFCLFLHISERGTREGEILPPPPPRALCPCRYGYEVNLQFYINRSPEAS